jgi:hypothetical protein
MGYIVLLVILPVAIYLIVSGHRQGRNKKK